MQSEGGRWTGVFGVRRGEELQNNSLLSAGVPGKEQVRRYPLHCFYSIYLTPLQRGEGRRGGGQAGGADGPGKQKGSKAESEMF